MDSVVNVQQQTYHIDRVILNVGKCKRSNLANCRHI